VGSFGQGCVLAAACSAALLTRADSFGSYAEFRRPAGIPFPHDNPYTSAKAKLGARLFFDRALSVDGRRSCAACHDPASNWSDGRSRALGRDGVDLPRRTPSLVDVAWAPRLFRDGRAATLEAQALEPIQHPNEMGHDVSRLVGALGRDATYRRDFAAAFPENPHVSAANLAKALATFERRIESGESPFDRWVAGDRRALSKEARRGFRLFVGKAGCIRCHSGWSFTDGAFYDVGLPGSDRGRGGVVGQPALDHAFRTPSLRDVVRNAPYMHDGSLTTLEDVLDRHARPPPYRPSLSPRLRPAPLDADERAALLAFLRVALTADRPQPAPLPPSP
jgi:cytochrome c peroxidase